MYGCGWEGVEREVKGGWGCVGVGEEGWRGK